MKRQYSDFLEISPNFESVVDIAADRRNANLWREYIVGDDMDRLMEVLCESLGNEAPDLRRSFWIHGSYGTGKSYAAIFTKHLMEEPPDVIDAYLSGHNRLSKYRNRFAKCRKNGDYLVIWKDGCTGIRNGDMMLIEMEKAIQEALLEKYGDQAYLGSNSLTDAVKAKLADPSINWDYLLESTILGNNSASVDVLRQKVNDGDLKAIQTTAAVIRQKGYGLVNNLKNFKEWVGDIIDGNHLSKSGIFFIWDEFTEYVEYSDDHTIMQQISEFCKEKPLFMLYVVHRSREMVESMGKERYQLIIHRFHQVEFHVSADAAFDLIAGSIAFRTGMEERWKEEQKPIIKRIKPFLPDMSGLDDKISENIHLYCPIHPMTIRLLSRVAESYAAAQRTMFRFMKDKSNADAGFCAYIKQYGPDDQACWLTPEWLWDYFFTRESDFSDKDTKAAEFIHHYEESRHLVDSDENASRLFKTALLLLAIMSSAKGLYGGRRTNGGISATVECLENCLAGVMEKAQIHNLLDTFEDCKILLRDEAANGVVRLQLPFRGGSSDDFRMRYEANDKKYSRYQMFAKEGIFSTAFEKQASGENEAITKRMKICVCYAGTDSIKNRLEEVQKELDKFPYKLGLLIVTVRDENQYLTAQSDLAKRSVEANEPRLTIALVRTPFSDEQRKKWLTSLTRQEQASDAGNTGDANRYKQEAAAIVVTWVSEAVSGGKIIAWNGKQVFSNQYGMLQLRKTIETNVLQTLFPYAPESIIITSTTYKLCNETAPLVGITRKHDNQPYKGVLEKLAAEGLLSLTNINDMAAASGSKAADSISEVAKLIREEMNSGRRVALGDLWAKLQKPPFGYYNTIACGILLGYVFSSYQNSAYSWTDNMQGTHVLGEATLKTMVLTLCKGNMTTDYLSAGTVTFQNFRKYVAKIFDLTEVQVANETECWHNMREIVTKTGSPFWALKYLPETAYRSADFRDAAMRIVDNIQQFIAQDGDREDIMSTVIQQFNRRGKLRELLEKSFQDKNTMNAAFRVFLFSASPELEAIARKLSVQPVELSDKLHMVMQDAIYTWTEEQVKEKLTDVVSEYNYLDALNTALGKVYHSTEDAKKDLANLFKFQRIAMAAIERLDKPWYPALQILYRVSRSGVAHMTLEERTANITVLRQHGKAAMDCLVDGKPILADILNAKNIECTQQELDLVYAGLKDISCDSRYSYFEKELNAQISRISQARNRIFLQERWYALTGKESVKAWCADHGAPLAWIVPKEFRKMVLTIVDVQQNRRTLDQDVQNAIQALDQLDAAILTDDGKISSALLAIVGREYADIFEAGRKDMLTKAKIEIGVNDMSAWDAADLSVLQNILKKALQEKAKKEKYAAAKEKVNTMDSDELRRRIVDFIGTHPEFCDDFTE